MRGSRTLAGFDRLRVTEEIRRQFLDLRRQCRGEQHRLPFGGHRLHDFANVVDEAHVKHPVRLIKDENANRRQIDRLPLEMVQQPSRSRDNDVDAAAQML